MNTIELGIGCMLYIVYIVGLNWSYIKEYKGTVKDCLIVQKPEIPFKQLFNENKRKGIKALIDTILHHKGVIKRGNEWD